VEDPDVTLGVVATGRVAEDEPHDKARSARAAPSVERARHGELDAVMKAEDSTAPAA